MTDRAPSPSWPGLVIPAFQPANTLVTLVDELSKEPYPFVIVVDDGSSADCRPVFEAVGRFRDTTVLRHAGNCGKGQALKTGFQHFLRAYPGVSNIITVDADGQHRPEDVRLVAERVLRYPSSLCLGVRLFLGKVPFRSRLGNRLTRLTFRLMTGVALLDTQTGLRGLSRAFAQSLLALKTGRYEFELDMLIQACRDKTPIEQVAIRTVYIEDNRGSHFQPLRDSARIYGVLFRHGLKSRKQGSWNAGSTHSPMK